jgi:CheY-like chemotaxis protein
MKTILVVDDEYAIAETLQELLSDEGFRVVTASNGVEGLRQVEAEKPHLVILDLMMPVMDGRAMLQALRANPETENLPVILTTAASLAPEGDERRVSSFIRKPFSIDAMLEKVNSLLNGR